MEHNPYDAPVVNFLEDTRSFDWRWLSSVSLAGTIILSVTLPLILTLLVLVACNTIAFIALLIFRQTTASGLAFLTGVLMFASLIFTDWGFSMPNPRITISWGWLIPACLSQLVLILLPFRLSNSQ